MTNWTIRGFDVDAHPDGRCVIIDRRDSKNGKVLCERPTIEAARVWINNQRRIEVEAELDQRKAETLRREAQAKFAHADALEAWGRKRKVVPINAKEK